MVRAKVNEDFCIGCGPCEKLCPEVFKIIDNISRVQVDTIPPEAEDRCYQAMIGCPVEAISLERDIDDQGRVSCGRFFPEHY